MKLGVNRHSKFNFTTLLHVFILEHLYAEGRYSTYSSWSNCTQKVEQKWECINSMDPAVMNQAKIFTSTINIQARLYASFQSLFMADLATRLLRTVRVFRSIRRTSSQRRGTQHRAHTWDPSLLKLYSSIPRLSSHKRGKEGTFMKMGVNQLSKFNSQCCAAYIYYPGAIVRRRSNKNENISTAWIQQCWIKLKFYISYKHTSTPVCILSELIHGRLSYKTHTNSANFFLNSKNIEL